MVQHTTYSISTGNEGVLDFFNNKLLENINNSPHTINLREVGGVDWLVRPSFKHLPHNSPQSNARWEVSVDRFEITLFSFIITSQHHSPQGCIERRVMISFFEQLFSDTPLFLIINQDLSMQGYSTLRTSP